MGQDESEALQRQSPSSPPPPFSFHQPQRHSELKSDRPASHVSSTTIDKLQTAKGSKAVIKKKASHPKDGGGGEQPGEGAPRERRVPPRQAETGVWPFPGTHQKGGEGPSGRSSSRTATGGTSSPGQEGGRQAVQERFWLGHPSPPPPQASEASPRLLSSDCLPQPFPRLIPKRRGPRE